MKRKKLSQISIESFSDSSIIKNLIASDSSKLLTHISLEHPFSFDGIILGICLHSGATIKINYREYHLVPNTIFTIHPNCIVEPVNNTDDFYVEMLLFSIDFLVDLPFPKDFDFINKLIHHPVLAISEDDMGMLIEYHSFIVKNFTRKKHIYTNNIARSLLYALLSELATIYIEEKISDKPIATSRGEEICEQFFRLLFEHHKLERNAGFYADKLFITAKYLSGILKKLTGKSINTWINEAVVVSAKVLLKSSDLTVLQISEELNFSNPSFFSRYFKQYAMMTPIEYREMQ